MATRPTRKITYFIGPDDVAPIFCGLLSGLAVGYLMWQLWLAAGP